MNESIVISPIGIINTPFDDLRNMPIQPKGAIGIKGTVVVDEKFKSGLKDLEGFSHIYLIYYFHKIKDSKLRVIPFMDSEERGVFATRAPVRPSKIGMSIVKLLEVNENIITFEGVDILDQTPLLDIKPYIFNFDEVVNPVSGWMKTDKYSVTVKKSDSRFVD